MIMQNPVIQFGYPFKIDGRGRVADANYDLHIRQMIEQVLFTNAGERVNRPDFGSGVQQLLFTPNSFELAATTQFLVRGALEQWLGELITVEEVEIEPNESRLEVIVRYIVRKTQQRQIATFSRQV
jgi:uncharacterized protein